MNFTKNLIKISMLLSIVFYFLSVPAMIMAQESKLLIEEDENGPYYTVKKGDTLWDISQKLLNSPWYWPELWKVNSKEVPIPNPHLIYPGQRLRLILKTKVKSLPVQSPPSVPATLPAVKAPLPPQPSKSAPIAKKNQQYFLYPAIETVGFIRKDALPPVGKIFKAKDDKVMVSMGDIVYIKEMNATPLTLRQWYTIYQISDPTIDSETKQNVGFQYMLNGVVEIIKKEVDFAIGKIVKSYRTIHADDLIMPYIERSPKIPITDTPPGITGKIITAQERTYIIGEHQIAFIDRGKNDGIKPGQTFSIFEQESADVSFNKKINLTPIDIGSFIVLLAEDTTSTVLITNSVKSFQFGTRFRSPVPEPIR